MVDECASDSPQHGDPANMAQHSNADSSLLEALPDELLMEVFEQFIYDENDENQSILRNDDIAHTVTFHSLCLVSKRIDLIARPYLFKKIYLEDFGTLMKFYDTIAGNEHLAAQIKEIDLDLELVELTEVGPNEREKLLNDCYQPTDKFWDEEAASTARECDLFGILCYKLLARAVNLSSLVMKIDRADVQDSDFDLSDLLRRGLSLQHNYLAFFDRVRDATRSAADGRAATFLSQLKKLTMWCHCGPLGVEAFEPFLDLPSLGTVQSIEDDGNWYRLSPCATLHEPRPHLRSERRARRNVTTLDLRATHASPYDIEDIAQLFPCLEDLRVQQDYYTRGRWGLDTASGSHGKLSTTLEMLTALQTLKIHIYPEVCIDNDLYDDITASLGPGNVLSVTQLMNLKHLEVPLYMFAHLGRPALGGTTAVPRQVLPQSLKTLVLLAQRECDYLSQTGQPCWEHTGEPCWDSMVAALEFLQSFGEDLPCFPHLQSVAYSFYGGSCGSPFSPDVTEGQDNEGAEVSTICCLQAISASFSKQNVEFLLRTSNGRMIDLQELNE